MGNYFNPENDIFQKVNSSAVNLWKKKQAKPQS